MEADESIVEDMSSLNLGDRELDQLIAQSEQLLQEVDAFITYVKAQPRLDKVQYRRFRDEVRSEQSGLLKLKQKKLSSHKALHSTRSSNLPSYQAIWDIAKRSRDVVSLKRHGPVLDLVADGGLQWIKVSLISQKRLLHEMAKQGWEWSGQSDSDSDDDITMDAEEDSKVLDISIVKVAKQLVEAAQATRVKYKHPSVTYVLPNITSGALADIDKVLDLVRAQGASILCANDLTTPAPALATVLPHPLVHDPFASFSPTLNIDCTILLALVSDISHASVPPQDRFNAAVLRQLAAEEAEPLMPAVLWPAMGARALECTRLAALRMREITRLIGTETEKQRMAILLAADDDGDDGDAELESEQQWRNASREQLLAAFEATSCHPVPRDWQLPVRIVPDTMDSTDARLPAIAAPVAAQLTDINRSVCLRGWATGCTTITSNRTVAKTIERAVEEHRMADDDAGPDLWVCWTSRSLVAKEKDRKSA